MITAIDHIVLSVTDLDKTIRFYCDGLGMELQLFTPPAGGPPRKALDRGAREATSRGRNEDPECPAGLVPLQSEARNAKTRAQGRSQ